jgi:ABC-type polysaccharide/polyol phosphate transport system ATPase subunit
VSHDLDAVERVASRVLWLSAGKIAMDGPAREAVAAYRTASEAGER